MLNSRTNRVVRPGSTSADNQQSTTANNRDSSTVSQPLNKEQQEERRHRLRHRRTKKEDRPEVLKVKREVQQVNNYPLFCFDIYGT